MGLGLPLACENAFWVVSGLVWVQSSEARVWNSFACCEVQQWGDLGLELSHEVSVKFFECFWTMRAIWCSHVCVRIIMFRISLQIYLLLHRIRLILFRTPGNLIKSCIGIHFGNIFESPGQQLLRIAQTNSRPLLLSFAGGGLVHGIS